MPAMPWRIARHCPRTQLDIADPRDIGGPLPGVPDGRFDFPLQSVESVTPIDERTLLGGLDNN